ncbi:MAG: hypothetical protein ACI4MB_05965 [Candidatus Coproplasma sp.]
MAEENEIAATADLLTAEEDATDTSSCPLCGGRLVYSPADCALKCEYCGGKGQIDMSRYGEELNFYDLINAKNNTWSNETHVFRCNNCGAKTVISKKEISKKCPFCGTTNVVQTEELCGLKPNAVLPFLLDKAQACESAVKWAKKRLFSPRKFKKTVYPEEIDGNYIPAFTFDTNTVTRYSGKLGRNKTRTKRVNGKTVTETYTEWFHISGTYKMSFDDFLVQASDSVKQKDVDKISPFDTNQSQAYSSDYLMGYTAAQYSKSGQECWEYARGVMQEQVKAAILRQYTYDKVGSFSMNMSCNDITYKYVLLPLYVGHYSYSKKLFNFFVNGRNGKVTGKAPVSPLRVGIAVLLGLVAVAGIAALIYFLGIK